MSKKRIPRNYLSNANLLEQLALSRQKGEMTHEFSKMIMLLCERYSKKSNFARYTFIADMQSYAILNIVKNWRSFDEARFDNPFAYYTQNIHYSFVQYLNMEKKHRNIRDKLLVNNGLDPSHSFSAEYAENENVASNPALLFNPAEIMFQEPTPETDDDE
jgi:hypothetical protein